MGRRVEVDAGRERSEVAPWQAAAVRGGWPLDQQRAGVGRRQGLAARRVRELPPYVFAALEQRIAELRARGAEVIDLGRADPDHDTPPAVVAALRAAVGQGSTHHYPPLQGIAGLRQAVARWYADRHGVALDPESEVLILGGSKEGLFHVSFAFCDPGDVALVPDPCFPAYRMGAYFAGAEVVSLPLRPEHDYLPELGSVPEDLSRRARILFLNYPNNPTGATAPLTFLREAVGFARRRGVLLCHDLAYGESGYDGYRPPSVLQVEGAKEIALEFITWSKAFCMPGWRLGAAVGCREAVQALLALQTQVSGGVFAAVQLAGAMALGEVVGSGFLTAANETYRVRRDLMVAALREVGLAVRRPQASPFLWLPCPAGYPSAEYADLLLTHCGVAVAPGSGFGAGGEGFVRLSLTASTADVQRAAERLRQAAAHGLLQGGVRPRLPAAASPPAPAYPHAPAAETPPAESLLGSL